MSHKPAVFSVCHFVFGMEDLYRVCSLDMIVMDEMKDVLVGNSRSRASFVRHAFVISGILTAIVR